MQEAKSRQTDITMPARKLRRVMKEVRGKSAIEAMKILNGNKDLLVRIRMFEGMTAKDEAMLFAKQFGESESVAAGARIRALIYAEDPTALAFQAPVKGKLLWEVDVEDASAAPVAGTEVKAGEAVGYVQTYYGMEEIVPAVDGRIVATLGKQGEDVVKGEIIAFIQ